MQMYLLCWLLSLCFSCCNSCCFSWCSCSRLLCSILNCPHQTHTYYSNTQKANQHRIYSFAKVSQFLRSFSLPGFADAVAAGKRRCEVVVRTVWGVKVGVAGWEAPCRNQGAFPALPPWGPWETKQSRMPALPLKNLGEEKQEKAKGKEGVSFLQP